MYVCLSVSLSLSLSLFLSFSLSLSLSLPPPPPPPPPLSLSLSQTPSHRSPFIAVLVGQPRKRKKTKNLNYTRALYRRQEQDRRSAENRVNEYQSLGMHWWCWTCCNNRVEATCRSDFFYASAFIQSGDSLASNQALVCTPSFKPDVHSRIAATSKQRVDLYAVPVAISETRIWAFLDRIFEL